MRLSSMFLPGLLAAWASLAQAQETPADPTPARPEGARHERGLSFVVAPIPISDPAIGNGLAVAALALYRMEGSERPWTTGAGGLYTDNKSRALVLGQKAYLGRDRFRVTAGGGGGVFNVDFYGIGPNAGHRDRSIPIEQKAVGGLVEGLIRVAPHFYAGFEYRIIDMRTSLDFSQLPFDDLAIPDQELRSTTSALGLAAEYDTRDSEYQPTRGLYATGMWLQAAEALGGDFDYHRAEAAVNGYHRLDESSVLAWRASVCSTGDQAPFYDLCTFGSQSDLRGYVNGQYRDKAMYAVQAEYRRHLFWRLGGVAFAGIGEVGPSFGKLTSDNLLPAAGVGLRLKASERYGVNVRVDYAWGKDSQALYISVGEAF